MSGSVLCKPDDDWPLGPAADGVELPVAQIGVPVKVDLLGGGRHGIQVRRIGSKRVFARWSGAVKVARIHF